MVEGWRFRKIVVIGIISSTAMTIACNSSTPVLGYAAGVLALCLWPVRAWMRVIRWGIVLTLVSLHLVMKAPVWNLINRIDISGGSSSWHRYMLVDQCIRHVGDWWLFGVKDTSVWGWDMWDTANQYVATCDKSGLIPFILFLAILVYGFKYLGRARRVAGKDKKRAFFIWTLGAALFANAIAFFGISYADQIIVAWYGLLALISTAVALPQKKEAVLSKTRPDLESAPSQRSCWLTSLLIVIVVPIILGSRKRFDYKWQGNGRLSSARSFLDSRVSDRGIQRWDWIIRATNSALPSSVGTSRLCFALCPVRRRSHLGRACPNS